MSMIDMPATEVVIERRAGEAGNRGLSPVSAFPVSALLWKISSGYGGQPPIDQLAISQLARHLALHDVDKRF